MNLFTESQKEAAAALRQDVLQVLNERPTATPKIEKAGGTPEQQEMFYEMVRMAAMALTTIVGDGDGFALGCKHNPDGCELCGNDRNLNEAELKALPFFIHAACQDAPFESVGTFRSAFGWYIGMAGLAMTKAIDELVDDDFEMRFGMN